MSPFEELQAAHERLSELRAASTPGEWYYYDGLEAPGGPLAVKYDNSGFPYPASWYKDEDVDLIVTLHRTIDAQLNILDNAMLNEGAVGRLRPENADTKVRIGLLLARAINGGD